VDICLDKKGGNAAVAQMIEILIEKNNMKQDWDKLWL
ncbi:3-deoxy-D-manno-octulosonate 8-phosphate phosphatase, partial [Campylobacter novaezeelandiae]|nr:3-deoxy-D-manno-octulosonate 8-phosphate phosphatase [Campylobacter novaezeelandiae]